MEYSNLLVHFDNWNYPLGSCSPSLLIMIEHLNLEDAFIAINKDSPHQICVMLAASLHFLSLKLFLILVNIIHCFIVRGQMESTHDYKLNLLALDFVHYLFNLYLPRARYYLYREILWICYSLIMVSFCFKDLEIL